MKLSTEYIYCILFILIIIYLLYLYSLNKKNIENFSEKIDSTVINWAPNVAGYPFDPNKDEIPSGLDNAKLTGQLKNTKPLETAFYSISNDKKYLYPALSDRASNWTDSLVNVGTQLKQYLPVGQKKTGTYTIYRNKAWPLMMADWYDDALKNEGDRSSTSENTSCKKLGYVAQIRNVNLGQNEARQVCLNDETCDSIVIPKYIGAGSKANDNLGTCKMYATRPGFPDELVNSDLEHTIIKNYFYTFTISFYIKIYRIKSNQGTNENKSGILYYGNGFNKQDGFIGSPIVTVQSQLKQPKINFEYVTTGSENGKNYITNQIDIDLKPNYETPQNVIIVVNGNNIYSYVDGDLKFDGKIEMEHNKSELDSNYKYLIFPAYQSVIIGKNPKYPIININKDGDGDFEISKIEWSAYALEKSSCRMFPMENNPHKIQDPINSHLKQQQTLPGRIHFNYDGATPGNSGEFLCNLNVIDNSHTHNRTNSKWIWTENNSILDNTNTSGHKIHNVQHSLDNNIVFIDGYIKCNKSFGPLLNNQKSDPMHTLENPREHYIVGCIPKSFCPDRNVYFLLAIKGGYMIMKISNEGKIIITPPKNMKYIKNTPISLSNIRYIKDTSKQVGGIFSTDRLSYLSFPNSNLPSNVYNNVFFNVFDRGQIPESKSNNSIVSVVNKNQVLVEDGINTVSLDGLTLLKDGFTFDSNHVLINSRLTNGFTPEEKTNIILVRDNFGSLGDKIIKISGNILISNKDLKSKYMHENTESIRVNRKEYDNKKKRYIDKYMTLQENKCDDSGPNKFCYSCADKAWSLGHIYYGIGDRYNECLTGNSYDYNDINSECPRQKELTKLDTDVTVCNETMNIYSAETQEVLICNLPEEIDYPNVNMIFLCASITGTTPGTTRILVKQTGEICWLSTDNKKENEEENNMINLDTIIYTIPNSTYNSTIEAALGG